MSLVKRGHLANAAALNPPVAQGHAGKVYGFDAWAILAFLYPLSLMIMFDLVGQLYLIDLLSVPLLALFLTLPDTRGRLQRIWPVLALLGVWFAGQVVTDLIRGSAIEDLLRGWSKIVFFALHLLVMWLWLSRRRVYMAAFAIGLGIASVYTIPPEFEGYAWKFGYAIGLSLTTIGVLYFLTRLLPWMRYTAPAIFTVLALIVLLQAARANFGILFLAGVIMTGVLVLTHMPQLRRRLSAGMYVILLLAGTLAASGGIAIYEYAVESGALGRDALEKYRDQASGDVPLLLGGRTESLVSVRAIADSPIIGHGSWARDSYYVELHRAIKVRLGLPIDDAHFGKRDKIPTHSHLMGAWVEAGVTGGLFWLWVLTLPFVAIFHLLKKDEILAPLIAFCAADLAWSVMFSPFGASQRVSVAFEIVVMIWAVRASGHSLTLLSPARRFIGGRKVRSA
ncbi:hypothetical protein ACXYL9_00605 [Qipengyuania sp. CAU 1752]